MTLIRDDYEEENSNNEKDIIKADFNAAWPKLVEETLADPKYARIPAGLNWLEEVMNRNVPVGKQNRGVAQVYFYRHLVENRDEDSDYLSYVLGWCVEILQAAALIADDIMDNALTRRGEPCWYLQDSIGFSAVNDALMLENVVYILLRRYFSDNQTCFIQLINLFHETTFQSILGQCLDTKYGLSGDITSFDMDKYQVVVEYKTGYYSFYLPIAIAMIHAGLTDPELYNEVEFVTLKMGYLFQVQDDYLDCYGDTAKTGKVGTDIIDGKCTWLAVKALEFASESQKETLKKCYGSPIKEDEIQVKQIYDDLKLSQLFFDYETREYKTIMKLIDRLPDEIPREPLFNFVDVIYQREK